MDEAYIKSILSGCGSERYPEAFLKEYEPFECLAHSDACETLLVKSKRTGLFFVAKCYTDRAALSHVTEADILRRLKHNGLPRFTDEYRNDRMLCVVREYVEGTPLDRYAAQSPPDEARILGFALELCDILTYLHTQTPPVIHRDIKPQNLIVDGEGKLWLIDFGISRVYDEHTAQDTVCYGTKDFAAPEQYGFAQTDGRADIFSLGILLGWLLTGEARRDNMLPAIADRRLKRVVEKCTAFAPEGRYATAARLRADLLAVSGEKRKRTLRRLYILLACILCLCAGFAAGRFTDLARGTGSQSNVVFEEPLVARAVRGLLGKDDGEPVSQKDLLNVTELYIYGDQTAQDAETYGAISSRTTPREAAPRNGGMTSLADIPKFSNLSILCVAQQNIADLTPLGGVTTLETVDLRHNPITDISPLGSLPVLKSLCLFGTRVTDLTALAGCPLLKNVDAGGTYVTSLAAFAGLSGLQTLNLHKAPLQTLDGVETFTLLEYAGLSEVADGDLTPLLSLPALQTLTLNEALRDEAERALGQAKFSVVYD